ncbi:MAG: TIGR03986 family CRISPR-associated RAMP protein [Thauera sp.]|jgi:CRISPR-associated protein (TIGR03986 family)|nr:TIGR03986 family CRISPR-associated RAMP protein [Thauera sp.]
MSQLSAPYRFIPLSRLILLPSWANEVSHDQPFKDGLCGELQLRLTTHTSLCVGGEQDKATESEPGKVHFFRTPDQRPAIPGSSLKGMLRNVLEIASFARFRQVEDQRLGVRDISEASNFYCKKMVQDPSRAGWLSFSEGQWHIRPCSFSRLQQSDLIAYLGVRLDKWKSLNTAAARYKEIGICPPIHFTLKPRPQKSNQMLAHPDPNGAFEGRIVVTGQPGKKFDDDKDPKKQPKKCEFVFHGEEATTLTIEAAVMTGFRQIHAESDEWRFWSELLLTDKLPQGIPVFYHVEGEQVKSLGLAMMYKLPYANSLHDAIRHTHKEHLGDTKPDLPDLIFGRLGEDEPGEEGRGGLRGRVNIAMARLAGGTEPGLSWKEPCILNEPKPTFYPAYMRQDKKDFRQLMENSSELAGWKRYPVKNELIPRLAEKKNLKVQVSLQTLPASTSFVTTLRFHNLRRVELGALLWVLDFGGRKFHRHALGMGKPFGLGQVGISVEGQLLRSNDPNENLQGREPEFLLACRHEFIDLMDQIVGAAKHTTTWENSAPIKVLLGQALPSASSVDRNYMPSPKDFVELRRKNRLEELKETFHAEAGIIPAKDFDTSQVQGYTSHFEGHLDKAGEEIQKQILRVELEKRKDDATREDALLLDIEARLKICLDSGASGPQKEALAKKLLEAYEISMDMDTRQKAELRGLAEQCSQIENKKIQHACKKILRDVSA